MSDADTAAPSRPPLIDPRFRATVEAFNNLFTRSSDGGGALAIHLRGEPVVDTWAGTADIGDRRPWQADTMAMSFSTTKGVTSTVVHRLVQDGILQVDKPVVTWWPEFGARGKEEITLADVMTHRSGLHRVRGVAETPGDLLDHRRMAERLAGRAPEPELGKPAYHAMTYGYLIAAIVERATGKDFPTVVAEQLAQPLGLDGLYVSTPVAQHHRIAPFIRSIRPLGIDMAWAGHWLKRVDRFRPFVDALLPHGFDELVGTPAMWSAVIPAANGVFTARSLSKMYGALANGGVVEGVDFLAPDVVHEAGVVRTRARDRVLGFRMRWRLGYHQGFTTDRGHQPRTAFGHYGLGGSGAFADPETGMSIAFVTNQMGRGTTPLADMRLPRMAAAAVEAARGA